MGRTSARALLFGAAVALLLVATAFAGSSLALAAPLQVALALAFAIALLPSHRGAAIVAAAILGALTFVRARQSVRAHDEARTAMLAMVRAPARCFARGVVASPIVLARGSPRWDARLDAIDCDGAHAGDDAEDASRRAATMATLYGGPEDLARGDAIEVVAQLAPPQRLWNSATGDPRPGEARRGVALSGGVVALRVVSRGRGAPALVDRARAHVRARIAATFSDDAAPMARAIVLGETDLAPEDDAAFRASGLAHLLAVSGMHLVLVVGGVVAALGAVFVRIERLAARLDAGRVAAAIGVGLAWAYASFAGGGGATLRAAWMMTFALGARALGRRSQATRAFALSVVAMAALDPLVAYDASFLLSATATAGLLFFARPLAAVLPSRALAASLAASASSAPVIATFAPSLPIGGAIANLIAVPLGESIALPLCLLHALLAPIPLAERGAAAVATGALDAVRAVARFFAGRPVLSLPVPVPTSWQLAIALVVAVALVTRARRARRAIVLGGAVAIALLEAHARLPHRGELRATFLDVGQGDAAILELPSGETMVLDGGGIVGSPVDVGARVLAPTLRARRIGRVAVVVLSHPHPDHFGGLATGLAATGVGALWDTGQGERESIGGAYAALLADARARGARVLRPDSLCGAHAIGGAIVEVLAPCPEPSVERGPNDNSLVVRVTYGKRALLFVGDAEREEEADLVRLGAARLRADVLKVGHHGSRTSSSPELLRAVSPSLAVISVGTRNRFGHPHPLTLSALAANGAQVLRTDRDGAVTVRTDGESLEVTTAALADAPAAAYKATP